MFLHLLLHTHMILERPKTNGSTSIGFAVNTTLKKRVEYLSTPLSATKPTLGMFFPVCFIVYPVYTLLYNDELFNFPY